MKKSLIKEKSYKFALDIIELYKFLIKKNEYVISKQILKSGTSIGANVEEALAGQSRSDFLSKMSIASKEARESKYWLNLLGDGGFLNKEILAPLIEDADSLIKILTSIVKTTSTTNLKPKTKNLKLSN
jgi:four helix bundle protein